jgi:hypothetical protein
MLPNHRLSAVPNYAPFLAPRDRLKSPLVDYHIGGNDIDDASGGLRVKIWSARYLDGQIYLAAVGVPPVSVLTIANVANFSFCFDQEMRPVIAYELTGGDSALRWWNPDEAEFQTITLTGARSPRVTLDDSRPDALAESDVLCTYLIGAGLYFREQRDAFAVPYLLEDAFGADRVIGRFGMNQRLAVQWQRVTALEADPAEPAATLLHAIDTPPFDGTEPGLGVWLAVAGAAAGWTGCSLEISRDAGATWEFIGTRSAAAIIGELVTLLPDHAAAPPADVTNTAQVEVLTPGAVLASVDSGQLASPINVAIVGDEQIQWADAAVVSGQTFDLDYLLRGKNGTTTEEHAIASRFVVLVDHTLDSAVLFLPLQPEDIGEVLQFRATTLGAFAATGFDSLTFEGRSLAGS